MQNSRNYREDKYVYIQREGHKVLQSDRTQTIDHTHRVATTCPCEHARARLPLIEAVRFAESLRKLAQSSDLHKNMDQ